VRRRIRNLIEASDKDFGTSVGSEEERDAPLDLPEVEVELPEVDAGLPEDSWNGVNEDVPPLSSDDGDTSGEILWTVILLDSA